MAKNNSAMNPTAIVKREVAVQKSFKGPIPSPEDLANYDNIQAGLALRIVGMAEREAASRQALEATQMDIAKSDVKDARMETKRGQWMSFIITMAAFTAAVICAKINQPWVASVIGGTTLVSVVSTIMRRNNGPRK